MHGKGEIALGGLNINKDISVFWRILELVFAQAGVW